MKIAVTSQNFQTVTGHAGRAHRFLIYDTQTGGDPVEIARLDLPPEQSFHATGGTGAHTIDGVDLIISAGFNAHFAAVMTQRGIRTATTEIENPVEAIRDYLVRQADDTLLPIATHNDVHPDAQ
jgi:predicted Fe-Mo cluster-binding NifX family protein